jgi:hypothetical protein
MAPSLAANTLGSTVRSVATKVAPNDR